MFVSPARSICDELLLSFRAADGGGESVLIFKNSFLHRPLILNDWVVLYEHASNQS